MVQPVQPNGHLPSKAVQKFNDNFELLEPLPPTALKILSILGSDGVAAEAVRMVGTVKSNVFYWKDKFLKAGALRLKCDGIVKYYELTPYGSKLLMGSEGVVRVPLLLEDRPLKFRVLRREGVRVDWVKLGDPRNWVKLGVRIGNVRVVLTQGLEQNLIIHPGQMKGFCSDELLMDSARVVERTRVILEEKFGMQLSDIGEVVGTPRFHVYSPLCKEWIKQGCLEVEGVGGLDASPTHDKQDVLNGQPHLEYADGKTADLAASLYQTGKLEGKEAIEAPRILKFLVHEVQDLKVENKKLNAEVTDLTEQLREVISSNRSLNDSVGSLVSLIKGETVKPESFGIKPIEGADYSR